MAPSVHDEDLEKAGSGHALEAELPLALASVINLLMCTVSTCPDIDSTGRGSYLTSFELPAASGSGNMAFYSIRPPSL